MECNKLYRCELCDKESFCNFNKKGHDDWIKNLRISNIRKGIFVTGSKGGLGSTLFSALLAEELSQRGFRVGLIETGHLMPMLPYYLGFDFESGGVELSDVGAKPPVSRLGFPYLSPLLFMYDEPKLLSWDESAVNKFIEGMLVNADWGAIDIMIFDFPFYQINLINKLQIFMAGKLDHFVLMSDPKMFSKELLKSQISYLSELAKLLTVVFSPINNNFDIKASCEGTKSLCLPCIPSVNGSDVKASEILNLLRQPYNPIIKEVSQSCLSIFSN